MPIKHSKIKFILLEDVSSLNFLIDLYKEGFKEYFIKISGEIATKADPHNDFISLPEGKYYDDKYYFVCFKKDQMDNIPIGVVDFISNYPNDKEGFLGLFLIDFRYQHQGVGQFMLEEIITFSKQKDISKLIIYLIKDDTKSINFFVKNGFKDSSNRSTKIINNTETNIIQFTIDLN